MNKFITTVTVDGIEYNITPVSAANQWKIQCRLMRAGAVPFAKAITETNDIAVLGSLVIAGIMDKLSEEDMDDITDCLLAQVRVKGSPDPVEVEAFQGQMENYLQLVMEALKFNFGGFMKALLPTAGGAETKTKQPKSRKKSIKKK